MSKTFDLLFGIGMLIVALLFLFWMILENAPDIMECNEDDYIVYNDGEVVIRDYFISGERYTSTHFTVNHSWNIDPLPCGNTSYSNYCSWKENCELPIKEGRSNK